MSSESLVTKAKKSLRERMLAMGYIEGRTDSIFSLPLGSDSTIYFMCHPRRRADDVALSPMIAIENATLRALIGEDEPKQFEPRFAHVFLSYTVNHPYTFWDFRSEFEMERVLDDIMDALNSGGIAFARYWAPFERAIELLKLGYEHDLPPGVMVHPTATTREVVERYSKPLH